MRAARASCRLLDTESRTLGVTSCSSAAAVHEQEGERKDAAEETRLGWWKVDNCSAALDCGRQCHAAANCYN